MPARLEGADDLRPRGVEELHADLDEGPRLPEALEEGEGLGLRGEVAGDDDVFSHGHLR